MKIYTGTGDRGKTSLFSGERVSKTSDRIEAYGDMDELNSIIGALIASLGPENSKVVEELQRIQSDLFANLGDRKYDLIVSNPPYVPASSMAQLPVEYRHEPGIALLADDQGMAIVHDILTKSANHLNDKGVLIVEVGEIAEQVHEHYRDLPFIWLDFEHGGEGVFLLHKSDLMDMVYGKSQDS